MCGLSLKWLTIVTRIIVCLIQKEEGKGLGRVPVPHVDRQCREVREPSRSQKGTGDPETVRVSHVQSIKQLVGAEPRLTSDLSPLRKNRRPSVFSTTKELLNTILGALQSIRLMTTTIATDVYSSNRFEVNDKDRNIICTENTPV